MLAQFPAEPVAAFASRTTDLSTRAYPNFPTELQLDLAVDHFISGLRDVSSSDYLRRERIRRRITWQEAVHMAQAAEVFLVAEYTSLSAASALDAMCSKSTNLAHTSTTIATDCAMSAQGYPGKTGNSHLREVTRRHAKSRICRDVTRRLRVRAFVVLVRRAIHQSPQRTEDSMGL